MATGIGSGILPFKVLAILDSGSVTIFGNQLDKNGTLGVISLIGLTVAAFMQPLSGIVSDRSARITTKRLPFMAAGAVLMALSAIYFGAAATFLSVLLATILIQLSGNLSQGPANALLVDHVDRGNMGRASGTLNLLRVAGAGVFTFVILQFMDQYDANEAAHWMWLAIAALVIALLLSSLWTILALRNRPDPEDEATEQLADLPHPRIPEESTSAKRQLPRWAQQIQENWEKKEPDLSDRPVRLDVWTYGRFLFALAFVIAAMSAMQVYALFFLQDVVGLDNPASGASMLVIVVGVAIAATVLPAGYLADRIGRSIVLLVGGGLGAAGATILLVANSFTAVLLDGLVIGSSVGIMLSVTWTVANDLVTRQKAARDLGLTSIAALAGAAVPRVAGVGIDALNARSGGQLGYEAMLVCISVAFIFSAIMLATVARSPNTQPEQTTPSSSLEQTPSRHGL